MLMGSKIYIHSSESEKKLYGPTMVPCRHCFTNHCSLKAKIHGRSGFCGKRCQSYFLKKSIKWRGGKSKKVRQLNRIKNLKGNEDFYKTPEWRELRFKVLRKFGFSCMACGRKPPDIILHVDHVKPRIKFPELQLDKDNLQVLCEDCNLGKRHIFQDDLRPTESGMESK